MITLTVTENKRLCYFFFKKARTFNFGLDGQRLFTVKALYEKRYENFGLDEVPFKIS